jgi:chitinase
MKRKLLAVCWLPICLVVVDGAFGQVPKIHGYTTVIPVKGATPEAVAKAVTLSTPSEVPLWTYSIVAYDGNTYTGSIVGRSPYNRAKTTTNITTQIVPLVISITDGSGTVVYDPTITDTCIAGITSTDTSLITNSPIFVNHAFTMNGVSVGTTQYIDAFQRAEFWSLVGGTNYHTMLSLSTLASEPLSFGATVAQNYDAVALFGGCGHIGVVDMTTMDNAITALITGPLAGTVTPGAFPIFLTHNVVMGAPGHNLFINCCVLGYHSGFFSGPNLQIYSPFSLDTSGVFGGDVETLSHEMGEAINDPFGTSPTPAWGAEGQVTAGNCQSNFEVGDPLSPGFATPTAPFTIVGSNGFTYHLQELAFFNWFFGGTNTGAGGKYSNNSTFGGHAKACPPGGTN